MTLESQETIWNERIDFPTLQYSIRQTLFLFDSMLRILQPSETSQSLLYSFRNIYYSYALKPLKESKNLNSVHNPIYFWDTSLLSSPLF